MHKLVIVESPNKVETIKKYLGSDFDVIASVGHIAIMSTRKGEQGLGIDLENWEPYYSLDSSKKNVIKALKEAIAKADIIYIATDPDREGEAIGDHIVSFLINKDRNKSKKQYYRIKYNEITKEAIQKAIENPCELDKNLIDSQKARRMLDRIIGFKLSQLMQKKISNSPRVPSAGRVQSIALKLVVDREDEINAFVPRSYHKVEAKLSNILSANIYFENHISGEKNWVYPEELDEVKAELNIEPVNILEVVDIKETRKSLAKYTPLKQAVLYKKSPLTSKQTQIAAQKLYEGYGDGGLISYPRTDSTRLSQHFLNLARSYIKNKFGQEYILEEIKGFAGDQDAHEAIRPTDITLQPEAARIKFNLENNEYIVYKLIYEHTLMSLINPPIKASKSYTFKKNNLTFKTNVSKTIFPGYYVVRNENEDLDDPNYQLFQKVGVLKYEISDHETKPPARYSEGSLIEALDNIKVGRPSTFATTVAVNLERKYFENIDKGLHPTDFGRLVLNKLINGFSNIINEGYTAEVEEQLDLIASNKITIQPIMYEFWNRFNQTYENATQTLELTTIAFEYINEKCPDDNGELIIRNNKRTDSRFVGCANFPNCHYARSIEGESNNQGKRKWFFRKKK
ncbi:type I DNA topoisomerase [Mycoplasmopsis caviae]|uniref:DNA topoisomerase 1 n=1 Tax=Mycoplasmopsis caviae TaxID=55603 RepID=A0A3P8KA05_9BACT|nr:type I DNA topoisomerase [Mycoplasmopsis caviae]UUD34967.1 type I DNA topoisomerase [Mycoplasmopsis caviae]VDR42209.1 DNA topoisomerase 1 [Mycoplasmopsis caviae]